MNQSRLFVIIQLSSPLSGITSVQRIFYAIEQGRKFNFNLSFDSVLTPPPIFICENNRTSNKIIHCVDLFLFLGGSFEDMGIFARIYLSICYGSI